MSFRFFSGLFGWNLEKKIKIGKIRIYDEQKIILKKKTLSSF